MQRSIGVTVIGILSLIGSALCLAMAALVGFAMFFTPKPNLTAFPGSPVLLRIILFFAVLVYVLPAIWGILTSVGLFRLKEWARISTIVFSVLLISVAGFAGLTGLLIRLPATGGPVDPSIVAGVRIFTGLFGLAFASLGVWWMVFFTRPKVKAQFALVTAATSLTPAAAFSGTALPGPPGRPERPLSVTVLAWLFLIGCLFFPLILVLRAPAVFFTEILTGWPAALLYVVFAAFSFYSGIGLLRLKENARRVAIGYYVFGLVNSAVFYLAPGGSARMRALIQPPGPPWMGSLPGPQFQQFDQMPFFTMGFALGVVAALVPLYFLVTRKQAFDDAVARAKIS